MIGRSNFRMIGVSLGLILDAGGQTAWHDSSPHKVEFVTVEEGVRLEVLDWGGSGRSIVLLAGSGNTAHVFDEFAPHLARFCHVYGITRRGFGASSQPESGYDETRLAQDIFEIITNLELRKPVLVGHSMAGGEITILGSGHSDRLGGLVYLDALFDVADYPASDPAYMALATKLPPGKPISPPTAEEQRSFDAYRARQLRNEGFAFPESELHAGSKTTPDGSKGKYKTPPNIFKAIGDGAKPRDYSKIRVPVLSINDMQKLPGDYESTDNLNADERAATDAYRTATLAFLSRWKKNLQNGPPSVHFVDLPHAGHYMFLTRPQEVASELETFLMSLAQGPQTGANR